MEQLEKVKILLVDDVPDKLLSLAVILEGLNQTVVTVNSGGGSAAPTVDRRFRRHSARREYAGFGRL